MRLEELEPEHDWGPVLAAKGRPGGETPPSDRSVLPGETVGARFLPTVSGTTEDILPDKAFPAVVWHPNWSSQGSGPQGSSVDELLEDVRRAMERDPEATRAAVSQLLTFLKPAAVEPSGTRGGLAPWQKRKLDRYLKQNLDRPLRLSSLAEQVMLSVSHFSRAFKESFGTTPHMHMVQLRLKLAQHLMLTTQDPLSQIACACGLADQAHLSKLFRRLVGETPHAWRRRNLTDAQAEARAQGPARGQIGRSGSGSQCVAASR